MKKNILALSIIAYLLVSCNAGSSNNNLIKNNITGKATDIRINDFISTKYLYLVTNGEKQCSNIENAQGFGQISQYRIESDGNITNLNKQISFTYPIQSAYLSQGSAAGGAILHVLLGCNSLKIYDIPIENNTLNPIKEIPHKLVLPEISGSTQKPLYISYKDFDTSRRLYVTGSSTYQFSSEWLGIYSNTQDNLYPEQSYLFRLFGSLMEFQPFQFDPNKNFGYLSGGYLYETQYGGGEIQKFIINPENGLINSYSSEPQTNYATVDSTYRIIPDGSQSSYRYSITRSTTSSENNKIEVTQENLSSTKIYGIYSPSNNTNLHDLTIHGLSLYYDTGSRNGVNNIFLQPLISNAAGFLNKTPLIIDQTNLWEPVKTLFLPDITERSIPIADRLVVLRNNKNNNLQIQTIRVLLNNKFTPITESSIIESGTNSIVDGFIY